MATSRSYRDACPIARALDVVGERWALLVVRELLLGPQRFSELRRALPAASTNMLADRLRELTENDVLHQRRLPPPAASVVYELTDRGRELAPALEALGDWGAQLPLPDRRPSLSAVSILLFLRGCLRAHADPPKHVYRIELDDRVWTIHTVSGTPAIEPGEREDHDAGLLTDPWTLNTLIERPGGLDAAITSATVELERSRRAVRALLRAASEGARRSPQPTRKERKGALARSA